MARQRRLRRPAAAEPLYSFHFLVICMVSFLSFVGIAVFLSFSSNANSEALGTSQSKRLFADPSVVPVSILANLDAILILGGGVPESVDHPPSYVERRVDDAVSVIQRRSHVGNYQRRKDRRRKLPSMPEQQHNRSLVSKEASSLLPILCLSAGTAHLPQALSADGLPIWEATACAGYLEKQHGMTKNVFVETTSYDTIGNAFYTRTTHTDVNGWRNLLIITSEFHMDRTMAIFDWIFLQCDPKKKNDRYQLYYLSSPNVDLTAAALKARQERETQSAKMVREKLAPKYKSLKDVWTFLTHEHALYTASKLVDRGRGNGDDSKSSWMVKQSYGAAGNKKE